MLHYRIDSKGLQRTLRLRTSDAGFDDETVAKPAILNRWCLFLDGHYFLRTICTIDSAVLPDRRSTLIFAVVVMADTTASTTAYNVL